MKILAHLVKVCVPIFLLQSCETAALRTFKFYEKNREWDKAILYLENQTKLQPRNVDLHYWLGQAYLNAKKYDKAYRSFQKALKLSAKYEKEIDRLLERAYRQQIKEAAVSRGAVKLSHLRNAVIVRPHNPHGNFYYGSELLRQGRPGEAVPYLEKAIHKLNEVVSVHVYLAQAYYKTRNYLSAEQHIQVALKRNPGNSSAHQLAGLIFLEKREPLKAIRHFQESLAVKWDAELAQKTYNLCLKHGQYQQAENILVRLCKQFPREPIYFEALVDVLFRQQKYAKALPYINKLLSLKPKTLAYLENKLMAHYWLGHDEDYQATLKQIQALKLTTK